MAKATGLVQIWKVATVAHGAVVPVRASVVDVATEPERYKMFQAKLELYKKYGPTRSNICDITEVKSQKENEMKPVATGGRVDAGMQKELESAEKQLASMKKELESNAKVMEELRARAEAAEKAAAEAKK